VSLEGRLIELDSKVIYNLLLTLLPRTSEQNRWCRGVTHLTDLLSPGGERALGVLVGVLMLFVEVGCLGVGQDLENGDRPFQGM
jgi:hypothetical protein